MSNNINLRIENFKNNLYKLANESKLPIAMVYYIYKVVEHDLE